MTTPGWVRRIAVVLLTTTVASIGGMLTAGNAAAHHCPKPDDLGNATVNVGGVGTVGLDQNNIGTDEHDVLVCLDPPHQETVVDVRNLDPGRVGTQVGAGTCGILGCTGVDYTGVEVGLPSTTTDPPLDGNGNVGAFLHTGPGVCAWVDGAPTCVLGGGTFGGNQPLTEPPPVTPPPVTPPPVTPFVDYMVGLVLGTPGFVDFCLWLMEGQVVNGALGCAIVAAFGYVVNPVLYAVDTVT